MYIARPATRPTLPRRRRDRPPATPLAHIDPAAAARGPARPTMGCRRAPCTPLAGGSIQRARLSRRRRRGGARRPLAGARDARLVRDRPCRAAPVAGRPVWSSGAPAVGPRRAPARAPRPPPRANGLRVRSFRSSPGAGGAAGGLSAAQWPQFGATLRQVPTRPCRRPAARLPTWEQPRPGSGAGYSGRCPVWRRQERPHGRRPRAGPATSPRRYDELQAIVARLVGLHGRLAARIAAGELRCTLCHAERPRAQRHVDEQGRVWLIDWDGASWSPHRARPDVRHRRHHSADLVRPHETAWFLEGYGRWRSTGPRWPYRYAWRSPICTPWRRGADRARRGHGGRSGGWVQAAVRAGRHRRAGPRGEVWL